MRFALIFMYETFQRSAEMLNLQLVIQLSTLFFLDFPLKFFTWNRIAINSYNSYFFSCRRFLKMTACLYEKDITKQDDIRNIHSIIGNVVNKILSRGMLKNCTFNIQKEIRLIEELNNSTCQQRQKQLEEEDEPLCSGHGYGLLKCRNGMNKSVKLNNLKGQVSFFSDRTLSVIWYLIVVVVDILHSNWLLNNSEL